MKVDTTPQDLTIGFQACLEAAAAAVGHELPGFLGALSRLHFSSTIATNTIVERRGAPLGLIVTRGPRQISTAPRPQARALGSAARPRPRPRRRRGGGRRGTVVAAPSEAELETAVRELLERGVRLLVVSFANAHLNTANELQARELIDRSYPRHYLGAVPLMVASRVSLADDDHGRTAAAVVNAYLHPNLVRALYLAEDRARSARPDPAAVDRQHRRVDQPRGQDARDRHLRLGSDRRRARRASYVARALGAENVCTFDVGGTTTDVSLLAGGAVPVSEVTEVGDAGHPAPVGVAALVRDRRRVDHRRRRRRRDPGRPPERRAPRPGRPASAWAGSG